MRPCTWTPCAQHVGGLEPWVQLALLLIHERASGCRSDAWGAYVATMPGELLSPLFWTDDKLAELLGGTQAGEQAMGYR
jgi:hypothetical protein